MSMDSRQETDLCWGREVRVVPEIKTVIMQSPYDRIVIHTGAPVESVYGIISTGGHPMLKIPFIDSLTDEGLDAGRYIRNYIRSEKSMQERSASELRDKLMAALTAELESGTAVMACRFYPCDQAAICASYTAEKTLNFSPYTADPVLATGTDGIEQTATVLARSLREGGDQSVWQANVHLLKLEGMDKGWNTGKYRVSPGEYGEVIRTAGMMLRAYNRFVMEEYYRMRSSEKYRHRHEYGTNGAMV